MAALTRLRVAVVGAGVFGLACGWMLARNGAQVLVYDPAQPGDNASGVAAGMLAPALESALDPLSVGYFPLLCAGRDGWSDLTQGLAQADRLIRRDGALFLSGDLDEVERVSSTLTAVGAVHRPIDAAAAGGLAPGLGAALEGLFTPEDWIATPSGLLAALMIGIREAGGDVRSAHVAGDGQGWRLPGGERLDADLIVLATGAGSSALAEAAPELRLLQPIKGQILHYAGGPTAGPIVRTPTGYLTPHAQGAIVGATMELGVDDRRTDPAVLAGLRIEAERLFPGLAGLASQGRAGVRATTPDGLPLVGRSRGSDSLLMAVGARRNGWLLAPLAAQVVCDLAMGRDPGPHAAMLAPERF